MITKDRLIIAVFVLIECLIVYFTWSSPLAWYWCILVTLALPGVIVGFVIWLLFIADENWIA